MNKSILNGPELAPKRGSVKQLVIFLHGYGSNGDDLIGLAPLMRDALPDAQFLSPNAPTPCGMGGPGFEWFQLMDRSAPARLAGTQAAAPVLDAYITAQCERFGLAERDIALVGFSQGTMMSLHAAPRRKAALAGVVGYSGRLIDDGALAREIASRPPMLLVHGTQDEIVPYQGLELSKAALEALDVPVETVTCPGLGHGIDPAGLAAGGAFLQKVLAV